MLKLFYITNKPEVALVAEKNGVDRIWIDLEKNGKAERQKGINAFQSDHSVADIEKIKPLLTKSEMLVRINPWFEGSEDEVEQVVNAGADLIMLPMWKSADEVKKFLSCVNGRAKTVLLLETKEAVECIDEVLELSFDEIHIGLNDLHISYGMDFMFEPLANGMVDELCAKFRQKGVPYGFGGIARLGKGLLKAEKVIMEHYRLGSTRAILSRSFCNIDKCDNLETVEKLFFENMRSLRKYEMHCISAPPEELERNRTDVQKCVEMLAESISRKKNET
jgi:2-keto-3-deoxy-L-rhamnonate aldolase RhmA